MASCSSCGHDPLPETAHFCPECGAKVDAGAGAGLQPVPSAPPKKSNFSETLWFKEGTDAEDEEEGGPLVDSDFLLERSKLQERYERQELEPEEREKFTLEKE